MLPEIATFIDKEARKYSRVSVEYGHESPILYIYEEDTEELVGSADLMDWKLEEIIDALIDYGIMQDITEFGKCFRSLIYRLCRGDNLRVVTSNTLD